MNKSVWRKDIPLIWGALCAVIAILIAAWLSGVIGEIPNVPRMFIAGVIQTIFMSVGMQVILVRQVYVVVVKKSDSLIGAIIQCQRLPFWRGLTTFITAMAGSALVHVFVAFGSV